MAAPKKKLINDEIEAAEASKVNPFEVKDQPPMRIEPLEQSEEEALRLADEALSRKYGSGADLGLQPFPAMSATNRPISESSKNVTHGVEPKTAAVTQEIIGSATLDTNPILNLNPTLKQALGAEPASDKPFPFENNLSSRTESRRANVAEVPTLSVESKNSHESGDGVEARDNPVNDQVAQPVGSVAKGSFEGQQQESEINASPTQFISNQEMLLGRNPAHPNIPISNLDFEDAEVPAYLLEQLEEERRKNELLRKAYEELVESKDVKLPANFWDGQPIIQVVSEPKPEVKWEGKNVRILFPCMKTTNPVTALCIGALLGEFGLEKIGMELRCGDSLIYHTRNRLTDQFLETKSEWAFFIDDDVIPPIGRPSVIRPQIGLTAAEYPDKFLAKHVIKDLLKHGKKLIGGVYFGRRAHAPAMFSEAIDNLAAHRSAKMGEERLIATNWVATGCMLIHRDTFLAIQAKFPDLAPAKNRPYWDYFRPGTGFTGDTIGGEDEMFCYRAHQAGVQAYVDTSVQALHVGATCFGPTNTIYDRFDGQNKSRLVGGDPNKWW